jgi:SH3-like domain-containing protein
MLGSDRPSDDRSFRTINKPCCKVGDGAMQSGMVAPRSRLLLVLALLAAAAPARAEDEGVPYWASINAAEANMRVGPGDSYRISWIYRRPHLPVRVLRREGPWRLIEDPAGDRGWMRDLLLSRQRAAIVIGKAEADMRAQPNAAAHLQWRVEPGVVGLLGDCEAGWCQFDTDGHRAFAQADRLWGTGEP